MKSIKSIKSTESIKFIESIKIIKSIKCIKIIKSIKGLNIIKSKGPNTLSCGTPLLMQTFGRCHFIHVALLLSVIFSTSMN